MILRCTAKLQAIVGRPDQSTSSLSPSTHDWYANLLWIEGRKCLLLTHAGTLFSVFAPDVRTAQLRPFGTFVVRQIESQLDAEGLPVDALGPLDSADVTIAKTADRSVLGCMNDLAFTCGVIVEADGGLARLDLPALHHHLQRHISLARDDVPIDLITGLNRADPG